ncbi:MAG: TetR/AcrR family transcriptional regulator [Actinobacteria bacterium]|nr:TetR/AcrR family transcriptional regulator [Actinomycetota bacterium]MBV8957922.1 TetR/AcrR family transcriptional regulator [Actinomycetota bacterium]
MPRPSKRERFDALVGAGLRVFAERGFNKAQMADVAAVMGVSQGTLYNYVESKEALFSLCLDRLLEPDAAMPELPVRMPSQDDVLARLRARLEEVWALPRLEKALATRRPADVRAELAEVIEEGYDAIGRRRLAFDAIERSAREMPEIAELYFVEIRRKQIARYTAYIEARIRSKQFRPQLDPPTATRLVLESVTYFARHRLGDLDSAMLDDDTVRHTVVDMMSAALLARP